MVERSKGAARKLSSNRGFVYYELTQYDKALIDYNKSLELDPESAVTYKRRGQAYLGLGQTDKAKADFEKALALNPNDEETKTLLKELA